MGNSLRVVQSMVSLNNREPRSHAEGRAVFKEIKIIETCSKSNGKSWPGLWQRRQKSP
jgi:hypothetical protein